MRRWTHLLREALAEMALEKRVILSNRSSSEDGFDNPEDETNTNTSS